jgi:hypothetical protein
MLTRPRLRPRTLTTGQASRGAQVGSFGGLSPWPASPSKQMYAPRSAAILLHICPISSLTPFQCSALELVVPAVRQGAAAQLPLQPLPLPLRPAEPLRRDRPLSTATDGAALSHTRRQRRTERAVTRNSRATA